MNAHITKCPHCKLKLGDFLWADACPHCHKELEHNTRVAVSAPPKDPLRTRAWPIRLFRRIVRLVES
jgi:hypothetical protein